MVSGQVRLQSRIIPVHLFSPFYLNLNLEGSRMPQVLHSDTSRARVQRTNTAEFFRDECLQQSFIPALTRIDVMFARRIGVEKT